MEHKRVRGERRKILSSSEIGVFSYCSNGWLLRRAGYLPDSSYFLGGIQHHTRHGDAVEQEVEDYQGARRWMVIGCIFFIAALILFVCGVLW